MKEFTLDEVVAQPDKLIDYLTYCSYAHNRDIAPHIEPEKWKTVFSNVDEMEKRYQEEKPSNMGVHVLRDQESGKSCMYCSVVGVAFGHVFGKGEDPDEFMTWLDKTYHKDPRELKDQELENRIYEWKETVEQENKSLI